MKFSMFYEIQVPKGTSEYETYHQILEQVELADRLGFHGFWTVEHHFMSEFAHCSAPEVLYGAVSQRTKNIRIGHAVVLLPFPYNHPIRVAERIATLDILSHGRMEVGTGRSPTDIELEGFSIPPSESRARWEEALDIITTIWKNNGRIQYEGQYFQIPEREVIPKVIQKPHPPLWMAASSPTSHELAGQRGMGLLSFNVLTSLKTISERIAHYKKAVVQATPTGMFVNNQAGTFTMVHCAETNQQARATAEESVLWYPVATWKGSQALAQRGLDPSYQYLETGWEAPKKGEGRITYEWLDGEDMMIVGDPERCREKVKRYQQAGVDELLCFMQIYKIPHEKIMDSIRLFGEEVMPHFR